MNGALPKRATRINQAGPAPVGPGPLRWRAPLVIRQQEKPGFC
jgi:hypothetical protein